MPCRAAGCDDNLFRIQQYLVAQPGSRQVNSSVSDDAGERIPHCLRLLVDLFDHKMLKTAFFSSFRIPGDLRRRQFNLIPVEIKEMSFSGEYSG